jgi:hypothetical protein
MLIESSFQKCEKPFHFPLSLLPVLYAAQLAKSGGGPSTLPPGHRCSPPLRSPAGSRPSAAQQRSRRLRSLTSGSCPSSPTLGRSPTGAGSPTPSRLYAHHWPWTRTPRNNLRPIKRAAMLRTAL